MNAVDLICHWCFEQGYNVDVRGPYPFWTYGPPTIPSMLFQFIIIEKRIVLKLIDGELNSIGFYKHAMGFRRVRSYPASINNPNFLTELKLLIENVRL